MIKRNSILIDGEWFDGDWQVETVDEETGELQIMVETLAEGARHGLALRMDMALAAELRRMAGFVDGETLAFEPCYDCRTTEGRVSDVEKRLDLLESRPCFTMHEQQRFDDITARLRETIERTATLEGRMARIESKLQRLAQGVHGTEAGL